MSRIQKLSVVAGAAVALILILVFVAQPSPAQGTIVIIDPQIDCLMTESGWCSESASISWPTVPEGATIISGCEDQTIDTYTSSTIVLCSAEFAGSSYIGGAEVKVLTPDHFKDVILNALSLEKINEGQANSLIVKIDAFATSLDEDNYQAAAGQMRAYGYEGLVIVPDPDQKTTPCFLWALEWADALEGATG